MMPSFAPLSNRWLPAANGFAGVLLLAAAGALAAAEPQSRDQSGPSRPSGADRNQIPREQRSSPEAGIVISAAFGREGADRVEVRGLSAQQLTALTAANLSREVWAKLLAVRVDAGNGRQSPAMFGKYRIEGRRLLFEPRFAFQPGLKYRATFTPEALPASQNTASRTVTYQFSVPAPPPAPPAVVEQVYPTRDSLPENLLKLYIHFSAPMSRGEAYERIHLLEAATGDRIEYPFLELAEELWDVNGTRLTLLFDPGRIKRGLKPREDVGPALQAGKSYILVVDREWSDASGQPLKREFRKPFQVVEADVTQPDPARWKLAVPAAGTTEPLQVRLDEPLDHAMLRRVVRVETASGTPARGRIDVSEAETVWRFFPADAWSPGSFQLVVEHILEDTAGNSIGRPFEVDLLEPIEQQVKTDTVRLPFQIPSP